MTAEIATDLDVPFLGLNYFDERHQSLFFGRDEQLRDLLAKLRTARLVTALGSSGSGKSSLVRAAAFPALRAGFLTGLRPRWRIVTMFPGSSPIRNLAAALQSEFGTADIELTLRRGRLGLLEAARQCALDDSENLLVFVDQFEEIFRFQRAATDRAAAADETSAFVQLLLEATAAPEPAIYAMVTMRSDYLGACAQFRNLPERINQGLYLIPRLQRDQLEDAITGPAAVMGASFAPPLVQRMLNDAGEDPDQLPVLQHALLRTWLNWKGDERHSRREIDFEDYEKTGGVRDSIDNHAEEIYTALSEADRHIAEQIFKALTERDPANQDIRRPTPVSLIAAIAGVSIADVARVAKPFRDERVAFLRPSITTAPASGQSTASDLTPETRLDITHESLIRKWYRLGGSPPGAPVVKRGWVLEEADLRDQYRDVVKRARAGTSPLIGTDLDVAIAWRGLKLPPEWALRYDRDGESYDKVLRYIAKSEDARERARKRRNRLLAAVAATGMLILMAVAAALQSRRDANRQSELRDIATARQLASQADALRDHDSHPELGALLGIEALGLAAIPEASEALRWPLALLRQPRWSKDPSSQQPGTADDDPATGESALRFSGGGRYLALLSNMTVRVHEVSDGREISLPPLHGRISSIAWSDDELRLLVRALDKEGEPEGDLLALAIAPGTSETRQLLKAPCEHLCDAELTRDGTRLLVRSETQSTAYPLSGGRPLPLAAGLVTADGQWALRRIQQQPTNRREAPARFSLSRNRMQVGEIETEIDETEDPQVDLGATSDILALSGRGGQIRLYEKEPELALAGHVLARGTPSAFTLSPDGELLAIGNDAGEVRIISWRTQRPIAGWSQSARIASVAFSPAGETIASLDETGGLRLVPLDATDAGSLSNWIPLSRKRRSLESLAWSFDPRGRFLLGRSSFQGRSDLFDTRTGNSLLHDGPLLAALSPDGAFVAAVFRGNRLSVMNLETNEWTNVAVPPPPGRVQTLSISPKGRFMALRTVERGTSSLQVVDIQRRAFVRLPPSATPGTGPTFSADGRWLAVYLPLKDERAATAMLVDCQSWEVVGTWEFNTLAVSNVFSPDSRWLLLRGTGPKRSDEPRPAYRIIDMSTKKERPPYLPDGTTLLLARYSPDGTLLALVSRQQQHSALQVFETESGRPIANVLLEGPRSGVAISAGNHLLATVSSASGLQVFDLENTKAPAVSGGRAPREVSRASLRENEGASALQFSEDEQSIVFVSTWTSPSAEFSETEFGIRRLRLSTDALIRDACKLVTRPLSPDEWKKYLPDDPYRDRCQELLPSRVH